VLGNDWGGGDHVRGYQGGGNGGGIAIGSHGNHGDGKLHCGKLSGLAGELIAPGPLLKQAQRVCLGDGSRQVLGSQCGPHDPFPQVERLFKALLLNLRKARGTQFYPFQDELRPCVKQCEEQISESRPREGDRFSQALRSVRTLIPHPKWRRKHGRSVHESCFPPRSRKIIR
jgi:hypothetical protein